MDLELTEQQEACVSWLRGKITEGVDGLICLSTDYRDNSPAYFGTDIEEIVELAIEDYADWDEG